MKYRLHIKSPAGSQTVEVSDELSIGRTPQAKIVIEDTGLSRVNTSFFIDDDELLVADENSTNGTFLNGSRLDGPPKVLGNGDKVKIGSFTEITVEFGDASTSAVSTPPPSQAPVPSAPAKSQAVTKPKAKKPVASAAPTSNMQMYMIAGSIGMTFLILVFGGVAIYLLTRDDKKGPVVTSSVIPQRVIDPLGGEDENSLDDLMASWETAETEINAADVADVSVVSADAEEAELNVSAATLADAQKRAYAPRTGETGIRPGGLAVPKELYGDGVIKQTRKLREMNSSGYRQPMDFGDLAAKRMNRELVEMPMATQSYYLDVGGSAQDSPFKSFAFPDSREDIVSGHPKFTTIASLAENFAGRKYDLNNSSDRKQMRMRLLRMFQPNAKPILKELADHYHAKFGRPLRVTSLTRSMDYQILLNAGNANSYKVRGEGSLPPHTSGSAFDLARKHMTAEEQNYVMEKLASMERENRLDALIEYGTNACFHVFIYDKNGPPKMWSSLSFESFEDIPNIANFLRSNFDQN